MVIISHFTPTPSFLSLVFPFCFGFKKTRNLYPILTVKKLSAFTGKMSNSLPCMTNNIRLRSVQVEIYRVYYLHSVLPKQQISFIVGSIPELVYGIFPRVRDRLISSWWHLYQGPPGLTLCKLTLGSSCTVLFAFVTPVSDHTGLSQSRGSLNCG